MVAIRLCFVGNSITTGTGDETMLGWPGRICAMAAAAGHDVTLYNLGVRGDTSEAIRKRWREEVKARILPEMNNHLVFAFGLNDCLIMETGQARVPREQTLQNIRSILTEAKNWLPTLFVGPAPVDDTRLPPYLPPGVVRQFHNADIRSMNQALAAVAAELQVPYLDIFTPLSSDDRWRAQVQQGDAVHPPKAGYDLMASLIADWSAWRALFL